MPSALFIRLGTGEKQAASMEASHKNEEAKLYKSEMQKAAQVTRNDYRDHFNLIPVYFFYDRDMQNILSGKLEGALLDMDLQPIAADKLPQATDFIIAYFGSAPAFREEKGKDGKITTEVDVNSASGKGLVVLGNNGKIKSKPFPYYVGRNQYKARINLTMETQYLNKKYNFSSREFDIDYLLTATDFQKRLSKYYKITYKPAPEPANP